MKKRIFFKVLMIMVVAMVSVYWIGCTQQKTTVKTELIAGEKTIEPMALTTNEIIVLKNMNLTPPFMEERYILSTTTPQKGNENSPGNVLSMHLEKWKDPNIITTEQKIGVSPQSLSKILAKILDKKEGRIEGYERETNGDVVRYEYVLYDSGNSAFAITKDKDVAMFYYGSNIRTIELIKLINTRALQKLN